MKNKVKLKKLLLCISILLVFLLSLFLTINIYEYHIYNNNFNKKLSSIVSKIEEKYPNITEEELIDVISSENDSETFFKKFSIDIQKDSLLKNNQNSFYVFTTINVLFYVITILIMIFIFLNFNKKKDKEINKITKCIEQINRRNYKLELDDMSEDELSILKNEIYKTTIMLKEAAENSNKEKLELKDSLSDISHQLKTPLTSILIILDNLIDDPEMDKNTREDFIKDIKREINSINFLVQSILKLSKFDTNTINFIDEEIELKKLINQAIKNISMLSDLRNVNINLNIKSNPVIKCDFKWQVEAISNILKNCVEHSNDNSDVIVTIEDNKIYSKITIKDCGGGIDEEDLPHIFERFYKGKNATPDSIGIGLSLAKTIIEKDNGTINVESNDKGSLFEIKYFK
ncbi:MAG: HAMP domain-containing sensor histidine kinase [bacterium]|nr:HAMP domain-containing sensor histidine kinase [bacterium]